MTCWLFHFHSDDDDDDDDDGLLLLLLLLLLLSLKTILNHVSISETVISENLSDNREIKIHVYAKRQT